LIEESPAAQLGQRGGMKTAERGPDYFKQIAAMRKTRAGGRRRASLTTASVSTNYDALNSPASTDPTR
jgi:hypothetical protein